MPRARVPLAVLGVILLTGCGGGPPAPGSGSMPSGPGATAAPATGSDAPAGTRTGAARVPDYPHAPGEATVRYRYFGGWTPGRDPLVLLDTLTLAGDGTLAMAGPPDAPAALQPVTVTGVPRVRVDALLARAAATGLLDEPDLGEPSTVVDAPAVTVTIAADGATHDLTAYAPDAEYDAAVTPGQARARAALRGFVADLLALQTPGRPYQAPRIAVYRVGNPWLPGPEPSGTADERPRLWPLTRRPAPQAADQDRTCRVVDGADAVTLHKALAGATTRTTWRIPGEPDPAILLFRPLLPGDPGCSRTSG